MQTFLKSVLSSVAVLLMALTFGMTANAAIYVKIPGIPGESADKEHKDWIIIESMSSPVMRQTAKRQRVGERVMRPKDGSAGSGEFTLTKTMDRSSPALRGRMNSGKIIPKLEIEQTSNYGGSRATYVKYELTNARITSFSAGRAAAGAAPTEEVTFAYEKIKWTYKKDAKPARAKGGNAETTWKVEKGEK